MTAASTPLRYRLATSAVTGQDIADALGISRQAVNQRIRRAEAGHKADMSWCAEHLQIPWALFADRTLDEHVKKAIRKLQPIRLARANNDEVAT